MSVENVKDILINLNKEIECLKIMNKLINISKSFLTFIQ